MLGMEALTRAIESAGGVSKLASSIGANQNVVSNWKKRGKVPAQQCIAVESATGISRHELRPDVFGDKEAS